MLRHWGAMRRPYSNCFGGFIFRWRHKSNKFTGLSVGSGMYSFLAPLACGHAVSYRCFPPLVFVQRALDLIISRYL